jgi:hypothetical protein
VVFAVSLALLSGCFGGPSPSPAPQPVRAACGVTLQVEIPFVTAKVGTSPKRIRAKTDFYKNSKLVGSSTTNSLGVASFGVSVTVGDRVSAIVRGRPDLHCSVKVF